MRSLLIACLLLGGCYPIDEPSAAVEPEPAKVEPRECKLSFQEIMASVGKVRKTDDDRDIDTVVNQNVGCRFCWVGYVVSYQRSNPVGNIYFSANHKKLHFPLVQGHPTKEVYRSGPPVGTKVQFKGIIESIDSSVYLEVTNICVLKPDAK